MSEKAEKFREEFMENLGLHKDTGKEIDRIPFNEKYHWVRMKCRNELGIPSWFAKLKPKTEDNG